MYSQMANELDLDWKDDLPQWLLDLINEWKNIMEGLNKIRIDRWTSKPGFEASTVSLLGFSDASLEGFGSDSMSAKNQKMAVRPMSPLSMPKLELSPSVCPRKNSKTRKIMGIQSLD